MNIYIQDEVIGFEGDRSTGNRLFLWETFHYLDFALPPALLKFN